MGDDRHWNRVVPEARPRGFAPRWDLDVGTNVHAPPLVVDTSHVIVSLRGPGRQGTVRALDLADGSTRWETTLERGSSAEPVQVGRLAITTDEGGGVVALDVDDGRTVWRASVGGPVQGGPLAVAGGLVVGIGLSRPPDTPGAVVGLTNDGSLVWRTELAREVPATPTRFSDGQAAVATMAGTVHLVDVDTGEVTDLIVPAESEHDAPDAPIVGSPVTAPIVRLDDSIVVLASSGTLLAADDEGTVRWAWEPVSGNFSSLASDGERVFLPGGDGRLVAFDARSGDRLWQVERLGRREPHRWQTPLVVGDAVLAPCSSGELVAVHAAEGRELAAVALGDDAIGARLATDAAGSVLVGSLGQARRVACWDLVS